MRGGRPSRGCWACMSVTDALLSLFVFFPLAILHWRGTWGLQDVYFAPNDIFMSSFVSLGAGIIGSLLIYTWQPFFHATVSPSDGVPYLIASRLHLYVCGWITMCYWRGVWNLMDLYLTEAWLNSVILMAVCQLLTFATRMSRNNVGLPVSIPMLDTDDDLLAPDTALKASPSQPLKYAWDVFFTQFIIVTANILIWRGIWNVCDEFIFPHRHLTSDLVSIAVGYVIVGLLVLLQVPLAWVSQRLGKRASVVPKVAWENVVMLVATWGNLLMWRGGWDLCLKYIIPDPLFGAWISHIMGTFGLIALQVFNNVAMNGMEMDGNYPGGDGIFPLDYLRILLVHDDKKGGEKNGDVAMAELLSPMLQDEDEDSAGGDADDEEDSGVSLEQDAAADIV